MEYKVEIYQTENGKRPFIKQEGQMERAENISRRELISAYLGNLFENYDTALFGFLAPFLAPLIFPESDALTALIYTYAMIPIGIAAKPLGSLVIGYFGDRYGRIEALYLSLMGMALLSCCIAFLPTYRQVGVAAPLLFLGARALQNFLSAGETMGGAIFLLEKLPGERHDLTSGFYGASSIGGYLLASFGVFLLSRYRLIDPGWRLLYLLGAVTALFALFLRRGGKNRKASGSSTPSTVGVLIKHRKALFLIAINAGFSYATYSIALLAINGLLPMVTSIEQAEAMEMNSYLLILDLITLPLFGWVASKISREKLMAAASLGVLFLALPLFSLLEGASFYAVVAVRVAFVLLGVAFFAPFHAFAQQLVPKESRYALLSIAYAAGSQLFGSPTASIALYCYKSTGMITSVAWYWMLLAAASSLSLLLRAPYREESLARG